MIVFTLPYHLPSGANLREHWSAKQRRVRAERWPARIAAQGFGVRPLAEGQRVVVTITRVAPRMLDGDNVVAAGKHLRDGIADALGIDDADPRVTWRYGQERGTSAVRVEVETT